MADGGTGYRIEEPRPRTSRRPRLLTPSECADAEPRGYVLKGILAPGDFGIVFGGPGTGKSVLAPHIAYAVAQGRMVFGRRVRPGAVIYVACEDPRGMQQRIKALRTVHGDAPRLRLLCDGSNLTADPQSHRAFLLGVIDEFKPALVVVDTLKAAFPGIDENSTVDMDGVVRFARAMTNTGCAVVFVHHSPKNGDTPRGSGVLDGDADVTIRVTMEGEVNRSTGTTIKNRNGPSGQKLAFDIAPVNIGRDEDDDAITAPIAKEDDASSKREAAIHLSPAEKRAREILLEVLLKSGRRLPDDGWHPKLLGAPEGLWREACDTRRLCTSEDPDNRRKVFNRTYKDLLEKKAVATRDGVVWATNPSDELRHLTDIRYGESWNSPDPDLDVSEQPET